MSANDVPGFGGGEEESLQAQPIKFTGTLGTIGAGAALRQRSEASAAGGVAQASPSGFRSSFALEQGESGLPLTDVRNQPVAPVKDAAERVVVFRAGGKTLARGAYDPETGAYAVVLAPADVKANESLTVEIYDAPYDPTTTPAPAPRAAIGLPAMDLRSGDAYGLNLHTRPGAAGAATMLAELIPSSGGSGSGGSPASMRIVVDNGFDLNGDGDPDNASRLDSSDGLMFYNVDNDAAFGGVADRVDSNGDGVIDERDASVLIDVGFDGALDAQRDLKGLTPEDLVSAVVVESGGENLISGSASAGTFAVVVAGGVGGFPLGALVNLLLDTSFDDTGGEEAPAPALFNSNGATALIRRMDLGDGRVVLSSRGLLAFQDLVTPPSAGKGKVRLVATVAKGAGGLVVAEAPFTFSPSTSPRIAGVLTLSGTLSEPPGAPVRLTGAGFVGAEVAKVSVAGLPATIIGVPADNRLDLLLPESPAGEYPVSGPIRVIVGAETSVSEQPFEIVAPRPRVIVAAPTSANAQVRRNTTVTVEFSEPVAGVEYGVNLKVTPAGGSAAVPGAIESIDGRRYVFTPAGPGESPNFLALGPHVVHVIAAPAGGRNIAAAADPARAFDQQPGDPGGARDDFSQQFTVSLTGDVTGPRLLSVAFVTPQGASESARANVLASAPVTLTFDEPLLADTVNAVSALGSVRVVRGSEFVPCDARVEENNTRVIVIPRRPLAGASGHRIEISPALKDQEGNTLQGAPVIVEFSTGIALNSLSATVGPVGALVTLVGGGFSATSTVTLAGAPCEVAERRLPGELTIRISAGAQTGDLAVADAGPGLLSNTLRFTVVAEGAAQGAVTIGTSGKAALTGLTGDARRGLLYVTNQGESQVARFDAETLRLVGEPVTVAAVPTDAVLTPDGKLLYVTNFGSPDALGAQLLVFSTDPFGQIGAVAVGKRPTRLAASPDGQFIYCSNYADGTVSAVSVSTGRVEAVVKSGNGPNGLAVAPDGRLLAVANFASNTVALISTASLTVARTVSVGRGPARVAFSPRGNQVFCTNSTDDTLTVLETDTGRVVKTLPVGERPVGLSLSPGGKTLFVVNQGRRSGEQGTIRSIDVETLTASGTDLPAGLEPHALFVSLDGSRLYVTNKGSNTVTAIFLKTSSHVITEVVPAAADPGRVVEIRGQNFNSDAAKNRVFLGAVPMSVLAAERDRILAVVPDGATSDVVTVEIAIFRSNPVPLTVTPVETRVLSVSPPSGAVDVGSDTAFTFVFNEPVAAPDSAGVVQRRDNALFVPHPQSVLFVNRSLNQPVGVTAMLAYQGRQLTLRPTAPLTRDSIYRIDLNPDLSAANLITDRSPTFPPNPSTAAVLKGASTFFNTGANVPPLLINATFEDRGAPGVSQGDLVRLKFSETVVLSAPGSPPASYFTLAPAGSSFGEGATLAAGAAADELDLALGAGAALTLAGAPSTLQPVGTGGAVILDKSPVPVAAPPSTPVPIRTASLLLEITGAETLDRDRNGRIDALVVTLNRDVPPSAPAVATGAGLTVSGYQVLNGVQEAGARVRYTLAERPGFDTGATPLVTYSEAGGTLRDFLGFTAAGYSRAARDGAAPVMVSASLTPGPVATEARDGAIIEIGFSEDLEPFSGVTLADFDLRNASFSGSVPQLAQPTAAKVHLRFVGATAGGAWDGDETINVAAGATNVRERTARRLSAVARPAGVPILTSVFVLSVRTLDRDADGRVEAAEVILSSPIADTSVTPADFRIGGVACAGFDTGSAGNDADLVLTLSSALALVGTGPRTVTYTRGSLLSTGGNPVPSFSEADVVVIDAAPPRLTGTALYDDRNNNRRVDAGDQVRLRFTEPVDVATAGAGAFSLRVTGDTLGASPAPTCSRGATDEEVIVTLGGGAALSPRGAYLPANTGAGAPSGVDVAASVLPGLLQDRAGNPAVPGAAGTLAAVDVQPIFSPAVLLFPTLPPEVSDLAAGDFNRDGRTDYIVSLNGSAGRVFLARADGGFDAGALPGAAEPTMAVVVGDVDRDGDLDVVAINFGFPARVYRNSGAGVFALDPGATTDDTAKAMDGALADVDKDGDDDLILVRYRGPARLLFNDGAGRFPAGTDLPGSTDSYAVAVADFNEDGNLDFIEANSGAPDRLFVGDGRGGFSLAAFNSGSTAPQTRAVAAGDFDGDGHLDLILGRADTGLTFLRGNGALAFTAGPAPRFANGSVLALDAGDLDRDGDLDLVVRTASSLFDVLWNDGSGALAPAE
ncbi:MAG: VCBS repeat-containing protein [Planctomycetes bacterium]|nr:VCBS repeat-containing protein [Planctomycetota bacterium]